MVLPLGVTTPSDPVVTWGPRHENPRILSQKYGHLSVEHKQGPPEPGLGPPSLPLEGVFTEDRWEERMGRGDPDVQTEQEDLPIPLMHLGPPAEIQERTNSTASTRFIYIIAPDPF